MRHDPLHKELIDLEANVDLGGWDQDPQLLIQICGDDAPAFARLPVTKGVWDEVGGHPRVLLGILSKMTLQVGSLHPDWPHSVFTGRPQPMHGIVVCSESWGVTGGASLEHQVRREAGLPVIPHKDNPDRYEARDVTLHTATGRRIHVSRVRGEGSEVKESGQGDLAHLGGALFDAMRTFLIACHTVDPLVPR